MLTAFLGALLGHWGFKGFQAFCVEGLRLGSGASDLHLNPPKR